jgi:hypothetical protein
VHFVVLSGIPRREKGEFVGRLAHMGLSMFVTGLAENALKALDAARTCEEISLALMQFEGGSEDGPAPRGGEAGTAVEAPELELPWAHPRSSSIPQDAFTQFLNTFDRLDEATKLLAVQTLKRLDPQHLERIQQELASLEPEHRLKAVKMVVTFHREEELEETLLKLARDPDQRVRATVARTLGILEDEPAIRALLQTVTDIDRRVVANSVEAIEAAGRQELLGLVRIFADHPNNRIRANAVKALWNMGDRRGRGLLEEMLADDDEMMRLSASWLLGEIDYPARMELLRKLARTDPSERVRSKALSILGETDDD